MAEYHFRRALKINPQSRYVCTHCTTIAYQPPVEVCTHGTAINAHSWYVPMVLRKHSEVTWDGYDRSQRIFMYFPLFFILCVDVFFFFVVGQVHRLDLLKKSVKYRRGKKITHTLFPVCAPPSNDIIFSCVPRLIPLSLSVLASSPPSSAVCCIFCCGSVLRVYLGMVLHANKRYLEALDMLELASKSEPRNPQVRSFPPACVVEQKTLPQRGREGKYRHRRPSRKSSSFILREMRA